MTNFNISKFLLVIIAAAAVMLALAWLNPPR